MIERIIKCMVEHMGDSAFLYLAFEMVSSFVIGTCLRRNSGVLKGAAVGKAMVA